MIPKREQSTTGGRHHETRAYTTKTIAGAYIRLCQNPLHDLRGWLDAQECRGADGGDLSARSIARMGSDGGLRPLRASAEFRAAKGLTASPCAPDAGIDSAAATAAYAAVFSSFDSEIAAVTGNLTLTPEQRQAMVANIRIRQRAAAEAARQWALDDERAAAKARVFRRNRLRRQHRR